MGKIDALLRGLPAHRSDGGAWSRNVALWSDEARRSVRSAKKRASACRRAAASGQRARHIVEHGRIPDEAEAWRANAHFPHDSGPARRNVRAAWRTASQHLHQFAAPELRATRAAPPPPTTAFGALLSHITGGADASTFQPMNINFGLFPEPPANARGKDRKRRQSERALADLDVWLGAVKSAAE